jgi:hypothetical protein
MSDDLNCLGQTPAQAAEFDAMCRDHDETVVKNFNRAISDAMVEALSHGMSAEEINAALRSRKIMI